MNARISFRLLIAVITFISVGLATTTVGAAQNAAGSDTFNREDVLVQDCRGASVVSGYSPTLAFGFDFQIDTSYTSDRTFHHFEFNADFDHQTMDQSYESFVGTAVNSSTGLSLAYDGHFSRISDPDQNEVTITDLELRLVPSHGRASTVKIDRDTSAMIDSPEGVLLAYAPRGLNMSLCDYFAAM
jgi:hypothetical protein